MFITNDELNFHKNQSNNAENIRGLLHPWYNLGFCVIKGSIDTG
jgi:hypothetical protein